MLVKTIPVQQHFFLDPCMGCFMCYSLFLTVIELPGIFHVKSGAAGKSAVFISG